MRPAWKHELSAYGVTLHSDTQLHVTAGSGEHGMRWHGCLCLVAWPVSLPASHLSACCSPSACTPRARRQVPRPCLTTNHSNQRLSNHAPSVHSRWSRGSMRARRPDVACKKSSRRPCKRPLRPAAAKSAMQPGPHQRVLCGGIWYYQAPIGTHSGVRMLVRHSYSESMHCNQFKGGFLMKENERLSWKGHTCSQQVCKGLPGETAHGYAGL